LGPPAFSQLQRRGNDSPGLGNLLPLLAQRFSLAIQGRTPAEKLAAIIPARPPDSGVHNQLRQPQVWVNLDETEQSPTSGLSLVNENVRPYCYVKMSAL
jgi:hypothetical protein